MIVEADKCQCITRFNFIAGWEQFIILIHKIYELPHDKTNNVAVRPAKAWASAQSDQSLRCALNG